MKINLSKYHQVEFHPIIYIFNLQIEILIISNILKLNANTTINIFNFLCLC